MGIKSNRVLASYFNRFGATGLDAVSPAPVPVYTEATGGIISDYTDSGTHYRAHIFTSSGTFVVSQVGGDGGGPSDVDYLVVAGGGSGGGCIGGGGGAGGLLSNHPSMPGPLTAPTFPIAVGSYVVTVGAGGALIGGPPPSGIVGNDGSNSVLTHSSAPYTQTSIGGGGVGSSITLSGTFALDGNFTRSFNISAKARA